MDINEIIRQHGNSVAVVFKKRGISAPVTAGNLMLQTILNKEDFINQLASQVEADHAYTGADGDFLSGLAKSLSLARNTDEKVFNEQQNLPGVTVTAKSKSSKLKNTLSDLLSVVGGGFGAYISGRNNQSTSTNPFVLGEGYTPPPEKKKPNYLLIGGIVLFVVLVAAVILKKSN